MVSSFRRKLTGLFQVHNLVHGGSKVIFGNALVFASIWRGHFAHDKGTGAWDQGYTTGECQVAQVVLLAVLDPSISDKKLFYDIETFISCWLLCFLKDIFL